MVAAGTNANEVAKMVGIEAALVKPATPGVIVTTKPMAPVLNAVAYTTDTHIHQLGDGRVVIGEKAGPPQGLQHPAFLKDQPNAYPTTELAMQHARRVIDTAKQYLPQLEQAEVEHVGVGLASIAGRRFADCWSSQR